MNKNVIILSLSCLFMLPPLYPAAGAFGRKMPDMAKGFKKSFFDKETREFAEKKMKEPIDIKNMKMERNGPLLGEAMYLGVHMSFAAACSWAAQQALSGAATAVNDTRDWVAAKNAGGVKGVVTNAVETAIVVGAPGAYMAGVNAVRSGGDTVEGLITGFSGKSTPDNPFVCLPPLPAPSLTGPGTVASGPAWMQPESLRGAHELAQKTATRTTGMLAWSSTPAERANMKVAYDNAHATYVQPVKSWNCSQEAALAGAAACGIAATEGTSAAGVFAMVEATAQAARAVGYSILWLP